MLLCQRSSVIEAFSSDAAFFAYSWKLSANSGVFCLQGCHWELLLLAV